MSSSTLQEQLIVKLGLLDEPHINEKSRELLRLLEIKASKLSSSLSEYSKIVLCIHLASEFLNIPLDHNNAVKLSGVKKSQYQNNKRTLEKILDLTKPIGVKDICIQLGLTDVPEKAMEILKLFQKCNATNEAVASHPQYAAMSIYQSCKILKKKLSKQKIIAFSHLKPVQWTILEKQFDKLIESNSIIMTEKLIPKPRGNTEEIKNTKLNSEATADPIPELEDYDTWKRRILAKARSDLAILLKTSNSFDKENILSDDEHI